MPVARLAESYQVLVVHPSLPVKTVAELVAYAKANPGKLNYSSAGIGNTIHLAGELFNSPGRHQDRARALQLGRRSDDGGAGRPGADDVREHHRAAAADRRRQAARARGHQPQAPGAAAGRSDHGRERISRLRRARVLRPGGAVRHAGADRRQAQRHHQCRDDVERDADHARSGSARRPARAPPAEFAAFIAAERQRWSAVAKAANISID